MSPHVETVCRVMTRFMAAKQTWRTLPLKLLIYTRFKGFYAKGKGLNVKGKVHILHRRTKHKVFQWFLKAFRSSALAQVGCPILVGFGKEIQCVFTGYVLLPELGNNLYPPYDLCQ